MCLATYWLNQLYVDPQDNVVYLNPHQKLFLYIQIHLKKNSIRRDNLDVEGKMETLWAFSGRFPCKSMKLVEVVKGLVHMFWHNNTRYSSNTKDVLKHCRGSMNNEPHVKHYLDMTQTQLFEMFKIWHVELRIEKMSFEK